MSKLRLIAPSILLLSLCALAASAETATATPGTTTPATTAALPNAPSTLLIPAEPAAPPTSVNVSNDSTSNDSLDSTPFDIYLAKPDPDADLAQRDTDGPQKTNPNKPQQLDANGNPIPLDRQQPQRILGFMPNFRSVAAGAKPHPPGWNYNFKVATRQAFDYSSFIFLGITSLTAEGIDSHPVLGKGVGGFYAYTWRGLLDKTDGTYLGAWLLPSLLHEDTRFYPLGPGHKIVIRALYVISRQGVARTYGGRQTPNIAGLGAKVLTQVVSREYYPTGATDFSVLATKFAYSAMRDIGFSSIREFYPDVAAHYIRKHREKVARLAQADAAAAAVTPRP